MSTIHILGLGPIGSLVAHHLKHTLPRDRKSVTLIHKTAKQALLKGRTIEIERNGLVTPSKGFISEMFCGKPIRPLPEHMWSEVQPGTEKITSLIITSKAHQTLPALRKLQPRLSENSTIVLLQNGMGVFEELATNLYPNPEHRPHFILATNNHGAYCIDRRVVHSGIGNIEFGIVPDVRGRNYEAALEMSHTDNPARRLSIHDITNKDDPEHERYESLRLTMSALLNMEGLNTSWRPMSELQLALRRKVVVNSVINPLTALLRCRNGDVFSTQAARDINSRVCAESANVFVAQIRSEAAQWLRDIASQGVDPKSVDAGRVPPSLLKQSLEEEVLRVASLTSGNKSSMLADIELGRDTEIDYMNGYLLNLGSAHNVPTPTITTLHDLIKMRTDIPLDRM
ncbi:hypothetical protein FA15DRAFT_690520 [Coprinopsis marcescibilis]|uniref:2-dehydropantoate 2-reductase n=1 Tax=Coprinopsis marcescibilis TaxID=230819 RepID=A0A5C3LCZ8_COPMA|nr:hypothetical protein FA15DRAFT_690520 [Coprinopsis marcescibilis]